MDGLELLNIRHSWDVQRIRRDLLQFAGEHPRGEVLELYRAYRQEIEAWVRGNGSGLAWIAYARICMDMAELLLEPQEREAALEAKQILIPAYQQLQPIVQKNPDPGLWMELARMHRLLAWSGFWGAEQEFAESNCALALECCRNTAGFSILLYCDDYCEGYLQSCQTAVFIYRKSKSKRLQAQADEIELRSQRLELAQQIRKERQETDLLVIGYKKAAERYWARGTRADFLRALQLCRRGLAAALPRKRETHWQIYHLYADMSGICRDLGDEKYLLLAKECEIKAVDLIKWQMRLFRDDWEEVENLRERLLGCYVSLSCICARLPGGKTIGEKNWRKAEKYRRLAKKVG